MLGRPNIGVIAVKKQNKGKRPEKSKKFPLISVNSETKEDLTEIRDMKKFHSYDSTIQYLLKHCNAEDVLIKQKFREIKELLLSFHPENNTIVDTVNYIEKALMTAMDHSEHTEDFQLMLVSFITGDFKKDKEIKNEK